jgi:hypothetical protein
MALSESLRTARSQASIRLQGLARISDYGCTGLQCATVRSPDVSKIRTDFVAKLAVSETTPRKRARMGV